MIFLSSLLLYVPPQDQVLNELTRLQTLGLAQTATIILQVEHGRGKHSSELREDDFDKMLMVRSRAQHSHT